MKKKKEQARPQTRTNSHFKTENESTSSFHRDPAPPSLLLSLGATPSSLPPPLPRPGRRVFPVGAVLSGPAPRAGAPAGPPARPKETRKAGTTESTRAREKTGQPRRKPGGRGRGGTKNRPRHGRPCRQTSHTAHPPPTPSAFFFKRV